MRISSKRRGTCLASVTLVIKRMLSISNIHWLSLSVFVLCPFSRSSFLFDIWLTHTKSPDLTSVSTRQPCCLSPLLISSDQYYPLSRDLIHKNSCDLLKN